MSILEEVIFYQLCVTKSEWIQYNNHNNHFLFSSRRTVPKVHSFKLNLKIILQNTYSIYLKALFLKLPATCGYCRTLFFNVWNIPPGSDRPLLLFIKHFTQSGKCIWASSDINEYVFLDVALSTQTASSSLTQTNTITNTFRHPWLHFVAWPAHQRPASDSSEAALFVGEREILILTHALGWFSFGGHLVLFIFRHLVKCTRHHTVHNHAVLFTH